MDHLQKWREENADVERQSRNPFQRWKDNDTRKSAIDAFCWQCMGGAEGARAFIRPCSSGPGSINPCPLHAWRPYK